MTHPSVISFGGHLEVKKEQPVFRANFDYFQLNNDDPSEPIRTLLFIADTHLGILRVFEEILTPVVKHNKKKWELHLNAVDARIGVHKIKWKSIIQSLP